MYQLICICTAQGNYMAITAPIYLAPNLLMHYEVKRSTKKTIQNRENNNFFDTKMTNQKKYLTCTILHLPNLLYLKQGCYTIH